MGYDLFHGYAIYPLISHHSKRSFIVRSIEDQIPTCISQYASQFNIRHSDSSRPGALVNKPGTAVYRQVTRK